MAKVTNAELQRQLEGLSTKFDEAMTALTKTTESTNEKIDGITARLDGYDDKIEKLEQSIQHTDDRVGELGAKVENGDLLVGLKVADLQKRVGELEEKLKNLENLPAKVEPLVNLPAKVEQLVENVEDRTNRQLRETLIFKNIPEEEGDDEDAYTETKKLLATIISTHVNGISYEQAFNQIKRAHRERKRDDDDDFARTGKRFIFAAIHSWDLCQTIIDTFREKCIADRTFHISADQKYGPITTKRRNLALNLRRELVANGTITSGYVNFPARLMVNYPGETVGPRNRKIYKLHTNFSKAKVEFKAKVE